MRQLFRRALAGALLVSAVLTSAGRAAPANASIFADALAAGWENWSWGGTVDFANASPARGSASMAVTFTQAWAGLSLRAAVPVNTNAVTAVRFWVRGTAPSGNALRFNTNSTDTGGASVDIDFSAPSGVWQPFTMTLAALGNPAAIARINIQDRSGAAQAAFYVDDVELISSAAGPTATPSGGPTLAVDMSADRAPISPLIYGMNFADEALAAELDLPVRRWGGNATTRYNWLTDVANRGSDWYFENIKETNSTNLPADSAINRFVEQDRRTGTKSLITVPLIGYVSNGVHKGCGFSVQKYGPQQSTDPYAPDCGNGITPGGAEIHGNDPLDASIAITGTFVRDWVLALKARFGAASADGVAFYNLDNEPDLWNSTHRDVFPNGLTYDGMLTRTLIYAAAVKSADPSAQTLGPVSWGWVGYWNSAADAAAPGDWWNTRPDRRAHGDVPLVPWYLQQLRAHEQNSGQRLLDYLDLHYYPQAAGVSLSGAGGAATQALRLRSTRSLWDAAYADESWINSTEGGPAVRLIPRMREWVAANYPGTRLAITEYNWGALDHINGALAQADVLGIFGREGVNLATLWGPPSIMQPGAFAFRMFRNYDGAGGKFGDTRVRAVSGDQDKLSIYAALRGGDGALTIMVINKTDGSLSSQVQIGGLGAGANAQLYRYSSANLSAIASLGTVPASNGGPQVDFPANSITLLVISNAAATVTPGPSPTPTPVGTLAPTASPANLTKRAWVPVVTR